MENMACAIYDRKERGRFMVSRAVADIRKNWAESDRKRDEGLTTPENIVRHDNISYGPYGDANLLDIYYTEDTVKKQPAIVNIHGGAWVYGSKEIYQFYCMGLAQRGFTVVNINYRLAPENKYPAALEDINRVFCFLKEKGEEYFVDTDNLFVAGDSAGGQLASHYLAIFTNPEFAKLFMFKTPDVTIRAAALNCGLYDARKCAEYGLDEPFLEYIGKAEWEKSGKGEEIMESLDTMKYLTGDFPPSFIMSAYHDFLLENAQPMYEKLTGLGVPCEIKIYGSKEQEEIAHVFHVNCKLEEAAKCNDDECAFFKKFEQRCD